MRGTLTPAGVNDLSFAFAIAAGEGGSHTCALRATGVPSCWGLNSSGQLGDGTTTGRTAPVTVNSFAANIKPLAELRHHGHEIEVVAFVQCVEGQHVHVQVELLQDGTFGDGAKSYACTDRLEAYSIRVRMNGGAEFAEGIAQASLVAEIRDRGAVLEVLEWSRRIQVIAEDDEHGRTNDE